MRPLRFKYYNSPRSLSILSHQDHFTNSTRAISPTFSRELWISLWLRRGQPERYCPKTAWHHHTAPQLACVFVVNFSLTPCSSLLLHVWSQNKLDSTDGMNWVPDASEKELWWEIWHTEEVIAPSGLILKSQTYECVVKQVRLLHSDCSPSQNKQISHCTWTLQIQLKCVNCLNMFPIWAKLPQINLKSIHVWVLYEENNKLKSNNNKNRKNSIYSQDFQLLLPVLSVLVHNICRLTCSYYITVKQLHWNTVLFKKAPTARVLIHKIRMHRISPRKPGLPTEDQRDF